jgi:Na+-exporting ATPase
MITKRAYVPACGTFSVEGANEPFNPMDGHVTQSSAHSDAIDSEKSNEAMDMTSAKSDSNLGAFLDVAALANISTVWQGKEDGAWHARGDPTEIAINVFAARFGWSRSRLIESEQPTWKTLVEFPFDSDVKKMSVILENTDTEALQVFTKGAVERVLQSCSSFYATADSHDETQMTDDHRDRILSIMEDFASQGLRVLALASRVAPSHLNYEKELDRNQVECDLTFRGLVGLYDPPRAESAASVKECRQAGIEVHMLTGDHPGTARAIAIDVGILPSRERLATLPKDVADALVMTAGEFDKLSDDQIDQLPQLPLVVARCAPNTKVRMIEALHRRKRFAAMVCRNPTHKYCTILTGRQTGDGVNDSPSLKRADVGIAMGQAGSDVAKDASDIVLTDDNFASIINAIEEGRRMFDNIQKFILHLLAENIAQACTLLIGLAFKDTRGLSVFPLAPVEILWVLLSISN